MARQEPNTAAHGTWWRRFAAGIEMPNPSSWWDCWYYCCVFYMLPLSLSFMCICCTLCVFVVLYVYLLYYMCIAAPTLDARLLARSQYPEGPATGHLDTGFSWFPCVYKRMLRWFPCFQVATTCLSCSPTELNFLVTIFFHICVHVK